MIFDIHTHIVPKIDDGSRSFEESYELVSQAKSQGVTSIISTSHYYVNNPSDSKIIKDSIAKLNNEIKDIDIYTGNEVLYFDNLCDKIRNGKILTLADSDFVLIEFYPLDSYNKIVRAIREIRFEGFIPVIAHAERYKALRENGLEEVISLGAYIQVSIEPIGKLFNSEGSFIKKEMKKGNIHFVGSDMHRTDKRPPVLEKGVKWIEKNIENYDDVLFNNACNIVNNKDFI